MILVNCMIIFYDWWWMLACWNKIVKFAAIAVKTLTFAEVAQIYEFCESHLRFIALPIGGENLPKSHFGLIFDCICAETALILLIVWNLTQDVAILCVIRALNFVHVMCMQLACILCIGWKPSPNSWWIQWQRCACRLLYIWLG